MPNQNENPINYICKHYLDLDNENTIDNILDNLCRALHKLKLSGFSKEAEVIEHFINTILEYLIVTMQYERNLEYLYNDTLPLM